MLRLRGTCFQNEPRFGGLRNRYAQDWPFVIGKLDVHGYIIEGLFFELCTRSQGHGAAANGRDRPESPPVGR